MAFPNSWSKLTNCRLRWVRRFCWSFLGWNRNNRTGTLRSSNWTWLDAGDEPPSFVPTRLMTSVTEQLAQVSEGRISPKLWDWRWQQWLSRYTALSPTELTKSENSGSSTATATNFETSCAFDKLAGAEALTYSAQFEYTLVPTGLRMYQR